MRECEDSLKEKILNILESETLDALQLAKKLNTDPWRLRLIELEHQGLIEWDKEKQGWRKSERVKPIKEDTELESQES